MATINYDPGETRPMVSPEERIRDVMPTEPLSKMLDDLMLLREMRTEALRQLNCIDLADLEPDMRNEVFDRIARLGFRINDLDEAIRACMPVKTADVAQRDWGISTTRV